MKKAIRFFLSLSVVVLYCTALVTFSSNSGVTHYTQSYLEQGDISAAGPIHFYGLAEQTESSLSTYKDISFPSIKNLVNGSTALLTSAVHLLLTPLKQCTSLLKNFPIVFGKIDIIFPFHYFW